MTLVPWGFSGLCIVRYFNWAWLFQHINLKELLLMQFLLRANGRPSLGVQSEKLWKVAVDSRLSPVREKSNC